MIFRRTIPLSSKLFAACAAILGAAAFLVVHAERERYAAIRPALGPQVTVVTASTGLPRGSVLVTSSLGTARIPEAFAPPGAIGSVERAVGRVLTADLAPGDVVTATRLAGRGVGPVAALVPDGLRAIGIAAPIPGGLRPGDRVDVLATFGAEGRVFTETAGLALEVLDVLTPARAALGPAGEGSPTLIVLATPDVAERLATATTVGSLQIAILGPEVPASAPASG